MQRFEVTGGLFWDLLFAILVISGTVLGIMGEAAHGFWCFGGAGLLWLGRVK